jgi:hypothetical protein
MLQLFICAFVLSFLLAYVPFFAKALDVRHLDMFNTVEIKQSKFKKKKTTFRFGSRIVVFEDYWFSFHKVDCYAQIFGLYFRVLELRCINV